MIKGKKVLSTTHIIVLGFLAAILIGSLLLTLPCSSSSRAWTPFTDALFTATTSVCVTGLVVVSTAAYWSLFGKIVILLMIQIGGLGIIAITSSLFLILRKKFTLKDAVLLESAFNLSSLAGIKQFLKRVFIFTFTIEGVCFALYIPTFVAEYGGIGVWYSLFHSVSAFCNAGIDILGDTSLYAFRDNIWLNLVTMTEIVLGGIGFTVMIDITDAIRKKANGITKRMTLSLHTKIVLIATAILIFGGALLFFIFEYSNPKTLADAPLYEKILASLFQSVTTRTAGFATMPQADISDPSALLSCLLMFIGGSPIGTAGGIKTTTFALLIISTATNLAGRKETVIGRRRISIETVRKATSVFIVAIIVIVIACMAMFIFNDGDEWAIVYEVVSALGTVGLSRDFTAALGIAGKIIITLCMFLGRIGPMSLVIIFSKSKDGAEVRYAQENITVG